MSKKDEALKLALDALDCIYSPLHVREINKVGAAMSAIREALAEQPAQHQEPVAYASDVEFDDETEIIPAEQKGKLGTAGLRIPLYIKPPASKPWVGLTDEEKSDLWCESTGRDCVNEDTHVFADAIEAKLREKNG